MSVSWKSGQAFQQLSNKPCVFSIFFSSLFFIVEFHVTIRGIISWWALVERAVKLVSNYRTSHAFLVFPFHPCFFIVEFHVTIRGIISWWVVAARAVELLTNQLTSHAYLFIFITAFYPCDKQGCCTRILDFPRQQICSNHFADASV